MPSQFVGGNSDKNIVVNTMTVEGEDQVMLKVKMVEIQRDVLKQFGVDFSALLDLGKFAFNIVKRPDNLDQRRLTHATAASRRVLPLAACNFEGLITRHGAGWIGSHTCRTEPHSDDRPGSQVSSPVVKFPISVLMRRPMTVLRCIDYKEYGVQVSSRRRCCRKTASS